MPAAEPAETGIPAAGASTTRPEAASRTGSEPRCPIESKILDSMGLWARKLTDVSFFLTNPMRDE
jgi:hypothetical protein